VGKPEAKKPLGRPRRRRTDNTETDFQEVGFEGLEWIDLAQDKYGMQAVANAVMNLRVP
jgi:hypothetical protein